MDYEAAVARFAQSGREYCSWLESEPASDEVFEATRLISRLHADAASLPGVDDAYIPTEADIPDLASDKRRHLVERLRRFPFQYYWETFDPFRTPAEEPVCGDILDDLADIYVDVQPALAAYEAGRVPQAVWHWRTTWGFHWGRHATSALMALQRYKPIDSVPENCVALPPVIGHSRMKGTD